VNNIRRSDPSTPSACADFAEDDNGIDYLLVMIDYLGYCRAFRSNRRSLFLSFVPPWVEKPPTRPSAPIIRL